MASTPSSTVNQAHPTQIKTPQSKLRLHYNNANKPNPSSNPNTPAKETSHPQEHPVEVSARIWDYPDRKEKPKMDLQTETSGLRIDSESTREYSIGPPSWSGPGPDELDSDSGSAPVGSSCSFGGRLSFSITDLHSWVSLECLRYEVFLMIFFFFYILLNSFVYIMFGDLRLIFWVYFVFVS